MNDVTILPAPEIEPPATRETAWERERRAFFQLLPSLLKTNSGQYVAVHDGTVVATGGLSELIGRVCTSVQHHEPWLTLHGLRLVFERNVVAR